MNDVLSPRFATTPYWTEGLTAFDPPISADAAHVDVAIVGAGYAGLSAARTLAVNGCSVMVLEADVVGTGASSSSAGSLSSTPKAKLSELISAHGERVARQIYTEARQARDFVERLILELEIHCQLEVGGRFVAAHSERAYRTLEATLPALRAACGDVSLVPAQEQQRVLGSSAFFGGVWFADSATLQPALLHRGLAKAAVAAGAQIRQHSRVIDIRRLSGRFEVTIANSDVRPGRGMRLRAANVIIATNAETGRDTAQMRRLRRRLTIVPAFALVTEEMSSRTLARVLPQGGSFSDTCKIIHYMATILHSNRLVMSGRAGRSDGDLRTKARRIFAYFSSRIPALEGVTVSHCWGGRFAISGDWLPHIGCEEGVHYMLGCCGTGVSMSTYLGHKVAQKILGITRSTSSFDRPLPRIAHWPANNLLLPLAVRAFALRDRWFR